MSFAVKIIDRALRGMRDTNTDTDLIQVDALTERNTTGPPWSYD